jgi:hypothetical protein
MLIRKKQKGGLIDNPANCNNDTTPIDLNEINSDSDVMYVGESFNNGKYHCLTPE